MRSRASASRAGSSSTTLCRAVAAAARLRSRVGFGYSLGYLGGGLLFAVNVAMVAKPALFGLADAARRREGFVPARRRCGGPLFTLPLLRYVRDDRRGGAGGAPPRRRAAPNSAQTLARMRTLPPVCWFLLAYWLYIDGVDTVIRMAVDYGLSLGLTSRALITALLITQFVGFPAALAFGRLGERIGAATAS